MKADEKELRDTLYLNKKGEGCKNYSIKAGAGGGKSTMLSMRICRQIAAGIPINKFVIITYTNAAAAELRDKIANRLRSIMTSDDYSESERENAGKAINSIELMQISTIHAFLLKILKEHAFETGITLDVRMLEDDTPRKDGFFNKWYHEHYNEILAFKNDWTIISPSTKKERDVTYDVFRNMFIDIAGLHENIIYDVTDHSADFDKAAQAYINKWLPLLTVFKTDLLNNVPLKKDGSPKKLIKDTESIIYYIGTVDAAQNKGIEEAVMLSKALELIRKTLDKGGLFYGKSGDTTALSGSIPAFPSWELEWNFAKLYKYMQESGKVNKVVEYVCKIQKAYQKEFDEDTKELSNDDILYRADKLLTSHPEVLDKLREEYSKIYVDEFQDTTGIQAKLVKLLSEKAGTGLEDNDLQDDKLIVVGDPKQSIYRFTGAEKAVYDDVDAMMDGMQDSVAESVFLKTNFRSKKSIVDWVNDKYSRLMPAGYSPMETDWPDCKAPSLQGVFKYEPDSVVDLEGRTLPYKKEDDVNAVVELVKKLVDDPHYFIEEPVVNKDGTYDAPKLRRIRYSDIMIICKVTGNMKLYTESFSESGIPVNLQGKFKISDDEVLDNFVRLIQYFAEPKNKKYRIDASQIISGIDAANADEEDIGKAYERLKKLRQYFRDNSMDTAAIVRYLLSDENLYLPADVVISRERVREYRIRLNQMVESCLTNSNGDMSELSILMNNYMKKEIKRELPLESNENAVRLMNVHQAKGLTGNIVIIADRSKNEACRYSGFKKNGNYYPAVSYKASNMDYAAAELLPSFGYDTGILQNAYNEETEEAIRLQYVAATRAANALIIMPLVYGRGYPDAWFSDKKYQYDSLPDIRGWMSERDDTSYDLFDGTSKILHTVINYQSLEENKSKTGENELSVRQLVSITPSSLEVLGSTGYSKNDNGYVREERPEGNIFGDVMHRVYELLFMRYETMKRSDEKDREIIIEQAVNQAILESKDDFRNNDDPEIIFEYLKEKMKDYYKRVIEPIMDEALEVYPEYVFSFYVDDSERSTFISSLGKYIEADKEKTDIGDKPIWVNGKADLVVKKKDGGVKVYDYKSDAMNGKPYEDFTESLAKKYEGQLALYRYAIGKAFDVNDIETELIDLYR